MGWSINQHVHLHAYITYARNGTKTYPFRRPERRTRQRLEHREHRAQALEVLHRHLRRVRREVAERVPVRRGHVEDEPAGHKRLALRRERVQRERHEARTGGDAQDPRPELVRALDVHGARAHGELAEARGRDVVVAREAEPRRPEVLGVERLEEREEGEDLEDRGRGRALEAEHAQLRELREDRDEDRGGDA